LHFVGKFAFSGENRDFCGENNAFRPFYLFSCFKVFMTILYPILPAEGARLWLYNARIHETQKGHT
jgi:hypothetical protein